MHASLHKSDWAWVTIALFVIAYDYWAIKNGKETLSRGFWRAINNPKSRWPVIFIWTGLYKHLVFPNFLPKWDLLYLVAERWHRDNEKRIEIAPQI